ncbi:hypothetical protein NL676_023354 [Syzygium grande]|nr:hypothetical protein NL676_023354 [Syzygium grande]
MASGFQRAVAVVVLWLFPVGNTVRGDPDSTLVDHVCNGQKYQPDGDFEYRRGVALLNIVTRTPLDNYNHYVEHKLLGSGGTIYAHRKCNGAITQWDCTACLEHAEVQLNHLCHVSIEA